MADIPPKSAEPTAEPSSAAEAVAAPPPAAASEGAEAAPVPAAPMTAEERFALVRSVGEECIEEAELRNLLAKKPEVRCYDGFEPSGRMHIAQGIFKAANVNKCTAAGCTFVFWVADWFALMNDKMGGELSRIRTVGQYFVEVWKAAGMDMSKVEFLWSSEVINRDPALYWKRVLDIGRCNTLARVKKCCQIMGRTEGTLTAAQIMYPLMQCSDVFQLRADICQLGVDQRKVNMLAREYCSFSGRKLKPVILSHHMLAGLLPGEAKMSKSKPDSAIFMEDTAEDVARKIAGAHCPRVVQAATGQFTEDGEALATAGTNPCLDYVRHVLFARPGATLTVAGTVYATPDAVEGAFVAGDFEEAELKAAIVEGLNRLLQPVRDHFAAGAPRELLAEVIRFREEAVAAVKEEAVMAAKAEAVVAAKAEAGEAAGGSGGAQGAAEAEPRRPAPDAGEPTAIAWLPVMTRWSLAAAAATVAAMNAAVAAAAAAGDGGWVVLLLPDWAAFAQNRLGDDDEAITLSLELALALLRAMGLHSAVQVVHQSVLTLRDPNKYWLDVIAAGRFLSLAAVEAVCGAAPVAGDVVSVLMRVADMAALNCTATIAAYDDGDDANRTALATTFFAAGSVATGTAAAPPFPATLCAPGVGPTAADDHLYADESELDLRRKLKKAYAAPGECEYPMADIARHLITADGGLTVRRSDANGGDKTYAAAADLTADLRGAKLHPGDLKAAVVPRLLALTLPAREVVAQTTERQWVTLLRNVEKKLAKKK